MASKNSIMGTDKRIRLGIWGLGRGAGFFRTCEHCNIDVVAGCDYNQHMRDKFQENVPGAFVTDNAEDFLNYDMDAVLLATFCPSHGPDAIKCLEAGKHVLSEVTSFHTMAEGVELVEAVEKSGLVYNLAENYPFSAPNMWLARKWREGLFGDLMYAEYEYVHEIRTLAYTYIDGVPIKPGHRVHNWRSWINFHYYNTHSLGPMMVITDTRPTRVVSLLGEQKLPGYPLEAPEGMGSTAPSLINMSNGAVVRNLMGAMTNDTHLQRIWGTRGAAELVDGKLRCRFGGSGWAPRFDVNPQWDDLGELAAQTGHGGGDFWVLYYFARQILTGEPGPFDIYGAADCTIPGILAYRSSRENGKAYDVPDFRNKEERDAWRDDDYACPRYDTEHGAFPEDADPAITDDFTTVMSHLCHHATHYCAWRDWSSVEKDLVEPEKLIPLAEKILNEYDTMKENYQKARKIVDAYPSSDAARLLTEMLETGEEKVFVSDAFHESVQQEHDRLVKKHGDKVDKEPGVK